jgi:hypothetical protein
MVPSWKVTGALVAVSTGAGLLLGACSEMLPLVNLPSMAKLPEKVLSKDEQQKTMKDMIEKGQTHQAEAAKQIEQAR